MACPFCLRLAGEEFVAANEMAVAVLDAFPLSVGHCLVVPRRHEANFLNLTPDEQAAMWALVAPVRRHIEALGLPDLATITEISESGSVPDSQLSRDALVVDQRSIHGAAFDAAAWR